MSDATGSLVFPRPADGVAVSAKLANIQVLRFFAAALVVAGHSGVEVSRLYPAFDTSLRRCGVAGVDLFFVISGFVMIYTTRCGDLTITQFLTKRIIRIVPLYWLATALMILLMLAVPRGADGLEFDALAVIKSFLFIPFENSRSHEIRPLFQIGWTLNYEMFFYLLFALTLSLGAACQIFALGLSFFILTVLQFAVASENVLARFYGAPIIIEFIFGMTIGWLYLRGSQLPDLAGFALTALGLLIFITGVCTGVSEGNDRAFFWGIPAAIALMAALQMEQQGWFRAGSVISSLGDSSYALYLSHIFVIKIAALVLVFLGFQSVASGLAVWCIFVVAAVTCGILVYRFLEMPLLYGLQAAAGVCTRSREI